jgi:putative DNA primase/helicase
LPRVDPFDEELLPVALRGWVMDTAHRMQCPPDYPAVGALVGLSSLIGARAVIQPKARDDWQVVPNLWGAVVGRPGVKKSPALNEALKPLHRLQAAEFELHKAAHDAWELDCKVSGMAAAGRERRAKEIADKDKAAARALLTPEDAPSEPTARSYVENDATVEKHWALCCSENPWGLLAYRDELYGLLTSLDKQGQEGSRAFYLTSYDGNQGYTFDRIGRGTVPIPRVCLAMIGGIQPGRIQEYVRGAVAGGSADDGLLQRFGLTVWPDVVGDFVHVDQWPDTLAKQVAWAVFDRLAQLQPASDTEPVIWRFTPAAQASFVEWLVPFEIELRGDAMHPAMVSHLAKYRKLIPALALVFALIDTPDSGNLIGEDEIVPGAGMGQIFAHPREPTVCRSGDAGDHGRGNAAFEDSRWQADRWRWRDPGQLHTSTDCGEGLGRPGHARGGAQGCGPVGRLRLVAAGRGAQQRHLRPGSTQRPLHHQPGGTERRCSMTQWSD